jgi:hypothetical protein
MGLLSEANFKRNALRLREESASENQVPCRFGAFLRGAREGFRRLKAQRLALPRNEQR